MTGTLFTTPDQYVDPEAGIQRDRYGRPRIRRPDDPDKTEAYQRISTFAKALSDSYALQQWMKRQTAIGLSRREDLLLQAAVADPDDKNELDRICEQAMEAAGSSARANLGTALHVGTALADQGRDIAHLPDWAKADINAYRTATSHLEVVDIETFGVLDALKVAGTRDRLYKHKNRYYVGDLKTGSIDYDLAGFTLQCALYSKCRRYDPTTGKRSEPHRINGDKAVIVHLPAGKAKCELIWVDISKAWEKGVRLVDGVKWWRSLKRKQLEVDPPDTAHETELDAAIADAQTVAELEQLWADHQPWTREQITAAVARKKLLLSTEGS